MEAYTVQPCQADHGETFVVVRYLDQIMLRTASNGPDDERLATWVADAMNMGLGPTISTLDQQRFFNGCMILLNLDLHELVEAGVIKEGNIDCGGSSWKRFNDAPLVFLAKIDDRKRAALWKLIEARQPDRDEPSIAECPVETLVDLRGIIPSREPANG